MSHLILKNIELLQTENIFFIQETLIIKIKYKLNQNIYTIGLTFQFEECSIIYEDHIYYLTINDINFENRLRVIDNFFKYKIRNYKSFLKNNKLILNGNNFIYNFYKTYKNKNINISISIKYIKKDKDNYPIIHIIENES